MATVDDIQAAVEVAQTNCGEALKILKDDTGVAIESIEITDPEADPPGVTIKVALAGEEVEAEPTDPSVPGPTIAEHFQKG